ncbi:MAG: MBL fold metallo-hydrolase [Clostridiales bacterium]|nr:MBL fold metallo-hydrolase [Clostridiales bacterium]
MMDLSITDVRVLPGDSGFLIDNGCTAILCDTGFGFTGYRMAEKIKSILGKRKLDYILLTHSHYDHVLGACYILKSYPQAKVVAGEYVKKIFSKPSARATMRALDRSAAQKQGVCEYDDLTDELKVDIAVNDGDEIACGDMTFQVIGLPGHTKCSIGFYMGENGLLLGTETLGVYFGRGLYLQNYLVGYQMTLDSFEKAKTLEPKKLLIPHYGVVERDEAREFLENSQKMAVETAQRVREIFASGGGREDAIAYFKELFYVERVRPAYPIDAFYLNTGIMVDRIRTELLDSIGECV